MDRQTTLFSNESLKAMIIPLFLEQLRLAMGFERLFSVGGRNPGSGKHFG